MADAALSPLKTYADIPVLDWDLQDPHASSYDLFRDLRAKTPLVRVPMGMGNIVLGLRARMVDQIVSPENTRQLETEMKMMQGVFDGPIFDFVAQVMLFANGEVHTRRRQPVARTFAFKLMEAMRPKAAAVAAEIITERLGKGPFDYLQDFAAQIPARIIADILGIPREDLPVFLGWISDTAESIGFIEVDRRAQIETSLTEFNAYVDKLLADRRTQERLHLRPGGVRRVVDLHRRGRADLGHGLYLLTAIELYLRCIDQGFPDVVRTEANPGA